MVELGAAPERLRVCFFIPDFGYGGAQKQCILLLNELQRRDDIELVLVRFRPGAQDHLLDMGRLRNEYVAVRSNFDLRAIFKVVRLVSECRSDVIISWVRVCDVYSFFVRLFHPRIKWVMTQRNSHHADSWLFRLRDYLGRRADAIAANSPGGVQWWTRRKARGPVFLVDNIAAPAPSVRVERIARSVLYVGRLQPQKNVLNMATAFALVAKAEPGVTINVCGDGGSRIEMEEIVTKYDVADRITFLGFRKDATVWMSRSTVLVSLSDHEGMPNVLMEGVQAGCTIVASAIPEHIDFLGPTYPYLVKNHRDPVESAEVIAQALAEPSITRSLTHAHQHLARMDSMAVGSRYMDIFRDVVVRKPAGMSYE